MSLSSRIALVLLMITVAGLSACFPPRDSGVMAGQNRMPAFPDPVPPPTTALTLPAGLIIGNDGPEDLEDPHRRLIESLGAAGFDKWSVYAFKDGFALVARWEQFREDGSPENERFGARQPKRIKHGFDFDEYAQLLFYAPPGNYRLFVFTVNGTHTAKTSQVPIDGNEVGPGELPEEIAGQSFADRTATAHVYVYQQAGENKAKLIESSPLDAAAHLTAAGIFQPAQLGAE